MRASHLVRFLVVIGALCLSMNAEARSGIFFKIALDEHTYHSMVLDNVTAGGSLSTMQALAIRMNEPSFNLESIEKNYYHVNIRSGVRFLEHPVIEYDLTPAFDDRFRHVVWVDKNGGHILRREVYDLSGKLIYAYGYTDEVPETPAVEPRQPVADHTSHVRWRGFTEVMRRTTHSGAMHRLFTDGLNRFSIFMNDAPDGVSGKETRIIYGNYVMRTVVDGRLYTVVGTIPFDSMTTIIKALSTDKEDVRHDQNNDRGNARIEAHGDRDDVRGDRDAAAVGDDRRSGDDPEHVR